MGGQNGKVDKLVARLATGAHGVLAAERARRLCRAGARSMNGALATFS